MDLKASVGHWVVRLFSVEDEVESAIFLLFDTDAKGHQCNENLENDSSSQGQYPVADKNGYRPVESQLNVSSMSADMTMIALTISVDR